jgi:hypothetical protein
MCVATAALGNYSMWTSVAVPWYSKVRTSRDFCQQQHQQNKATNCKATLILMHQFGRRKVDSHARMHVQRTLCPFVNSFLVSLLAGVYSYACKHSKWGSIGSRCMSKVASFSVCLLS